MLYNAGKEQLHVSFFSFSILVFPSFLLFFNLQPSSSLVCLVFMEIAFQTRSLSVVMIHTFLWSFLSVFMSSHGSETDIFCLKSIKDSLEDPYNHLLSWDFNNNTEGFICEFKGVECWHFDENKVLNLNLSYMGLKGVFPRGIKNCSSLSGLNLTHNKLSGSIPSDINKLVTYATSIDLSHNNFTGKIPESMANCTYLNVLKLDNNKLLGPIPLQFQMLHRLKLFNVSNNHLSGQVPKFSGRVIVDYKNNEGLCGGILKSCADEDQSFKKSFKYSLIIGYVVSATSVIAFHASCCVPRKLRMQKKRKKIISKARKICESFTSIAAQMRELLPLRLPDEGNKEVFTLLEKMTSRMSFAEIYNATECFGVNNIVGFGKMGIMYEARLPNGWLLAVKRLSDSQQFKKQFALEIMILCKYKHRNIIHLLGFCSEIDERILVYQYMSNGRLSKWLHPLESEAARLEWPLRFKIALGIARGLSWLHHSRNVLVVHLNLSSKCILLDQNFQPKISNFGEAKILNQNSGNELGMSFFGPNLLALAKKDVSDFGSVLFELITGKIFDELADSSICADISGNALDFYDVIDKSLVGKGFEDEIFCLLKVACECVQLVPDRRPTMLQVYKNMNNIWEKRRFCDNSDIISKHSEIGSATSRNEIVEFIIA